MTRITIRMTRIMMMKLTIMMMRRKTSRNRNTIGGRKVASGRPRDIPSRVPPWPQESHVLCNA
eukprot:6445234-Pyramimonas_sp.AAC.1